MPTPFTVPSSDAVDLAVYDFGGRGTDALLVHANGFCAAVFAPLVAELAPWRCAAFDARAHGRSTSPSGDMAWEGHRDDVLTVVERLGLDRPIGIGHSMGGAALLLAEADRPGTFRALWLYEPIVFPPDFAAAGDNPLVAGALRRRDSFDTVGQAYSNYASKPPLDELSPESLSAYVHHGFAPATTGGITLRCRPEAEAAGYHMSIRHGAWDALGEVQCPVVVARGGAQDPGPATVAPAIATGLPHGRLEEHPTLGHFGPLARPSAVAAAIRADFGD